MNLGDLKAKWDALMAIIPEQVKNIVMYGVSGFLIGFFGSLAAGNPAEILDPFALRVALSLGCYQAVKEIADGLRKYMPSAKTTKASAKNTAPASSFVKRML